MSSTITIDNSANPQSSGPNSTTNEEIKLKQFEHEDEKDRMSSLQGQSRIERTDWVATLANINSKITEAGDKADEVMHTARAQILMRMGKIEESIADCERAKKIEPTYIQAYIQHSKALAYKNKMGASYEMLKQAWLKDKTNQGLKTELEMLEKEIKMDQLMPKDHPNRLKMQRYIDWLRGNGAVFNQKLRLRSESDKDWEVIAMKDIEKGEAILKIPEKFVMTYEKV